MADSVTTQLKPSSASSSLRVKVNVLAGVTKHHVAWPLCHLPELSPLEPPPFASVTGAPSVFLGYLKHTPPWGLCTRYSLSWDVLSPDNDVAFPLHPGPSAPLLTAR